MKQFERLSCRPARRVLCPSHKSPTDWLLFPPLPATQFPNTLRTGGINHERTFPFRHYFQARQDDHDGRHFVCQLQHSHRNRQQQVIHETYTVHAWNRLADWVMQTLKPGARVLDGVTTILEVDGLKFKDLNGNGQLDVYEDWRQDVDARVKDLYDQMTLEEKAGLFYHVNTCGNPMGVDFADSRCMFGTESTVPDESSSFTSRSMWYYINVLNITSHLDNTNGTPAQQIVYHNAMQALAEDSRLGIPIVISNDREYNAWGGMIDVAHDAFGAANDVELSKKLWTAYSLESRAVGIHVVLHPYGQELGSWNGEDPEYAGTMTKEEVLSLQVEGGVEACMKHFIARGGDSSFADARSDAQTVDNWMKAWEIALSANPKWVMTNGYNTGLTNTVHVDYDKETMDYLRKTLGFEGIIVSDWGESVMSRSNICCSRS